MKISKELKNNIMEFINAPIGYNKSINIQSHPQAYHTSHLFDFTSEVLNDQIIEKECFDCQI